MPLWLLTALPLPLSTSHANGHGASLRGTVAFFLLVLGGTFQRKELCFLEHS